MPVNWIDWVIIGILLYYGYQGWIAGFADLGFTFVTFFLSLWLAIKFHTPVGDFFSEKFGIAPMWTTVLGYILVAFVAEIILSEVAALVIDKIPKKVLSSKINKWFGIVISLFNGLVIISFVLLVILALPLRGTIRDDIKKSAIGNFLATNTEKYGGPIKSTIEQAKEAAIKFRTIEPGSKERVALDVAPTAKDLEVDDPSEREMLALINEARVSGGLRPLTVDVRTVTVARAHSRDMFLRRYFSHVNPEGEDGGDRLDKAGIQYTVAGENLAYSPDVETAHQGLMNSPGHRRNILEPSFGHIGIGIIRTERYGMMVTQDFTN